MFPHTCDYQMSLCLDINVDFLQNTIKPILFYSVLPHSTSLAIMATQFMLIYFFATLRMGCVADVYWMSQFNEELKDYMNNSRAENEMNWKKHRSFK